MADNAMVLLNGFIKKTQKTPSLEFLWQNKKLVAMGGLEPPTPAL